MTTLDERIAHHESELARLRAERDAEPRRWWAQLAVPGSGYAVAGWIWLSEGEAANACGIDGDRYIQTAIQLVEHRPGWRLVRDEPAPFVVTDSVVRDFYGPMCNTLGIDRMDGPHLALALTRAGIPAVAEGVGS